MQQPQIEAKLAVRQEPETKSDSDPDSRLSSPENLVVRPRALARDSSWETAKREAHTGKSAFPSPAALAGYRDIDPKLMDRVVFMAEREQRQRHWRERAPEWTARLGVVCGLIIALAGLGTGGYLANIGSPVPGALLSAADLFGLVGVFIYGSRRQPLSRRSILLSPGRANGSRTQEAVSSDE